MAMVADAPMTGGGRAVKWSWAKSVSVSRCMGELLALKWTDAEIW